jgi:uncharacterized Zn-binding protein involved in type VI secretion
MVATHRSTFRQHPIRWAVAGIALFLLLLGLLALSALAHLLHRAEQQADPNGLFGGYGHQRNDDDRTMMRHTQPPLSTGATRVSGVVTAVNGDSFTVAGNGTTKTVTTNGSTVYNTSGNKVAVNDSVTVTGVISGDTFTATRVMVQNQ